MADNLGYTEGVGKTVRSTESAAGHIQHMRLDLGSGASESVASGTVPVSAASLPLPTGAATSAKQDTGNASLSSIDGKITACNTGAIAGTVAISQSVPGTSNAVVVKDATGAELDFRQENENWNAADHGVLMFGRDTASVPNKYRALNLNAEGDLHCDLSDINGVEPSVNNGAVDNGTLRVTLANNSTGTVTVSQGTAANLKCEATIAAAQSVGVTQSTAANLKAQVQIIDGAGDSAMDDVNNAVRVNLVAGGAGDGAILDGVSSSVKATVLDYTNSNPLAVRLTDTNGDYIAAGGGTQYADGAVRGTATGTLMMGDDATNIQSIKCDSSGVLAVQDNGGALTVDQATAANLNAQVVGNVAHDGADSGNPVKVGAIARTANPSAVTATRRTDLFADDVGRLVVVSSQCRDLVGVQTTNIANSSAETTIVTAGAAGVFNDITSLCITNRNLTTAFYATLKDSTGGTTRAIYDIAAGGGIVLSFNPPLPQAAAANNWTITLSSASITVDISVVYVKNV